MRDKQRLQPRYGGSRPRGVERVHPIFAAAIVEIDDRHRLILVGCRQRRQRVATGEVVVNAQVCLQRFTLDAAILIETRLESCPEGVRFEQCPVGVRVRGVVVTRNDAARNGCHGRHLPADVAERSAGISRLPQSRGARGGLREWYAGAIGSDAAGEGIRLQRTLRRRTVVIAEYVDVGLDFERVGGLEDKRCRERLRRLLAEFLAARVGEVGVLAATLEVAHCHATGDAVGEAAFKAAAQVVRRPGADLGNHLAFDVLSGLAGHEVDGTGEGGAAEVGALRALQHFDAFHIDDGRWLRAEYRSAVDEEVAARVEAGVEVEIQAAEHQRGCRAIVAPRAALLVDEVEAWRHQHHIAQLLDAGRFDFSR